MGCVVQRRSLPQVRLVELETLDAAQAANCLDRVYLFRALPVSDLDECVVDRCTASDVKRVDIDAKINQKLLNLKRRICRGTRHVDRMVQQVSALSVDLIDEGAMLLD